MKKSIIALTLAVAAIAGSSASAQDKMYRPQQFTDFAFEGILLDIDQQTKIDSINAAVATPMTPAMRPDGVRSDKGKAQPSKSNQRPDKKDKKDKNGKKGQKGSDKADNKGDNAKKRPQVQVTPAEGCTEGQTCDKARGPKRGHMGMRHEMRPEMRLMPGIEYIISVKEVLTPEQFETFLNNLSSMPSPKAPAQCPAQGCSK